jgi:hypothetical protein
MPAPPPARAGVLNTGTITNLTNAGAIIGGTESFIAESFGIDIQGVLNDGTIGSLIN